MKKFLSMIMVLILVLILSACGGESTTVVENNTQKENESSTKITLTAKNVTNIVSSYGTTLFVINPDKTVSVVGTNKGHCEVQNWTDIEKIFATENATYGIQSDGTCLVAENHTSSLEPEYNNACEITQSFVLLSDGRIIPRYDSSRDGYTVSGTEKLPKCVDILEIDYDLFCVTQEGYVHHYCFDSSGIDFEYTSKLHNKIKHLNDIKEISCDNHCHLTAVGNNGKAYTYFYDVLIFGDIAVGKVENNWPQVTSCVPAGERKFLATTTENKVVGCGGEFDEIGGNTPKILLPENALKILNFYGHKDGNKFNYAIAICQDFSAVAYCSEGPMPYNISKAFSKWSAFTMSY